MFSNIRYTLYVPTGSKLWRQDIVYRHKRCFLTFDLCFFNLKGYKLCSQVNVYILQMILSNLRCTLYVPTSSRLCSHDIVYRHKKMLSNLWSMLLKPYEVRVLYAEHCILKINEVFLPLIYAFRTLSAQSSVRKSLYIDAK